MHVCKNTYIHMSTNLLSYIIYTGIYKSMLYVGNFKVFMTLTAVVAANLK